jgi:hypothetical protein
MNKSCEKKTTAHSQNMLHVDVKERNTKRFVLNWHSPSLLQQNDQLLDIYINSESSYF